MVSSFNIISASTDIKPPTQPLSGPGGSNYSHTKVLSYTYGEGAKQYWIFEPGSPKPNSAPVIVFNHGWTAMNPIFYQAWIDHLVKKGNIVIYPRYQTSIFTNSDEFTPNVIWSVKDAFNRLKSSEHVKPEVDNFALVGHSVGGLISINMAALADNEGLPIPKAVFCVEPGKSRSENDTMGPELENLSNISPNTLLLTLAGDRDDIVGSGDAEKIIQETKNIPAENKNYIIMVSDEHGQPPLIADHIAPLAINFNIANQKLPILVNALDYYGTWKLFDGLYEAAFYGENQEYALGNTTQQRFMGIWSDGTPVKQLLIQDI
ncbi:MAG: alpha/beta hydrolase family protein [Methanomicrobiales archaeon]